MVLPRTAEEARIMEYPTALGVVSSMLIYFSLSVVCLTVLVVQVDNLYVRAAAAVILGVLLLISFAMFVLSMVPYEVDEQFGTFVPKASDWVA